MTTTLVLVRHAPTLENEKHVMIGRTNPALHETGRAKALQVAHALIGMNFNAIVSSPLHRAVETAQAIARLSSVTELEIDETLREIDLGVVDGVSSVTAYETHREAFDCALSPNTEDFAFPDGEMWSAAANRFQDGISRVLDQYRDKTVCIVTHGGVLGLWKCRLDGIYSLGRFREMQPKHASFSVAMHNGGQTMIHRWGDVSHLI